MLQGAPIPFPDATGPPGGCARASHASRQVACCRRVASQTCLPYEAVAWERVLVIRYCRAAPGVLRPREHVCSGGARCVVQYRTRTGPFGGSRTRYRLVLARPPGAVRAATTRYEYTDTLRTVPRSSSSPRGSGRSEPPGP